MAEKVFVAQMSSECFDWLAVGRTEEEAKKSILKAWNRRQFHLKKSNYARSSYYFRNVDDLDEEYGITVTEIEIGKGTFL